MFTDIINMKRDIKNRAKNSEYERVAVGRVTHVSTNLKQVRVQPLNVQTSYVTFWLKPSTIALGLDVEIDDLVFYFYNSIDPENGYYFDRLAKDETDLPDFGLTEEDLEAYNQLIQDWVTTNFVTYVSLVNTLSSYRTNVEANLALARSANKYIGNNFVQASKNASVAVSDQWIERHLTLYCNGSPLPPTGGTQDGGNSIGINIDGAATMNNSRFAIGTLFYLKTNTTARIELRGINGITINGSLNPPFLLLMRACYEVKKTAATTWTLVNMNDFNYVPYS